jgi:hypothetical protein
MQSELFNAENDPSKAHSNPESQAAHAKLKPTKAQARRDVWLVIYDAGMKGVTLEDIGRKLGKPASAISGRCTELAALGMIWRRTEKGVTSSGNSCALWIAK